MNQLELLKRINTAQQEIFNAVIDMLNEFGVINFSPNSLGMRFSFSNDKYVNPDTICRYSKTDIKFGYYDKNKEYQEVDFYSLTATDVVRLITCFQIVKMY